MIGTITVQSTVGVNKYSKLTPIDFYPNPAENYIYFSKNITIKDVIVYSITGKKVLESNLVKDKLDISILNSGAYFIKLITDDRETIKKLVVK